MAVAHANTQQAFSEDGNTSLACNAPTGSPDRLVGWVAIMADNPAMSITLTGWTLIARATGSNVTIAAFHRAPDASPTYTANVGESNDYLTVFIGGYSGVDSSSPIAASSQNTGSGGTATGTGVTATAAGVLLCGMIDFFGHITTTPSGMTRRAGSTSADPLPGLFDESISAGATGNRTATAETGIQFAAVMVALSESGGGGGGDAFGPRRALLGVGRRELTRDERGGRVYSLPAPAWQRTEGEQLYTRRAA